MAATASLPAGSRRYGLPALSDFQIAVADPVKQGDGVGSYVSYIVKTRSRHPSYRSEQTEVVRRFRDFTWLQDRLRKAYCGFVVPPLPERNVVEKYKMTTDFIEQRRLALEVFLNRIAAHSGLQHSPDLQLFLEANETEFAIEVSRGDFEGSTGLGVNAAKKTLSGALQLFRTLGHSASNMYQRKTNDDDEDPEYLKVRTYLSELEKQLGEVHRHAARLVRHRSALGIAVQEFGAAMQGLGRHEESGAVSEQFDQLGEKAETVSLVCFETSESLARSFEAPLKEFVRMVRAANKVAAERSAALAAYQQVRADVDAHRARLAKVRGTPGIREERVAEVERDLNSVQRKADEAKAAFELISSRMKSDVARFQQERTQEMAYVLRDFAVAQSHLSSDSARLWRSLVPGLAQADAQ